MIKSLKELKADLWVFDCDGVIYENAKLAEKKVVDKMIQFIALKYNRNLKEAASIRIDLLKKHNVKHTIMALVREGFNEDEILEKTYFSINLSELGIVPSTKKQELISCLNGSKAILTNNHCEFAKEVFREIGILKYFPIVHGIKGLRNIQKPNPLAFQLVQEKSGIKENIVFVDDEIQNVIAAKKLGWTTVLIGADKNYNGLQLPSLC